LASKERDAILNYQKSVLLKPSKVQLKELTMSYFENTLYIEDTRRGLKNNHFVKTM